MTGLRIFEIDLPFGSLSVWREFAGEYWLASSNGPLGCRWLTIGEGLRLGRAGETIERRFHYAGRYGQDVKTGSVFARREGTRDPILELGAVDNDTIELRFFGSAKWTLRGDEAGELLEALCLLAADARSCGGGGSGSVASRLAR